MIDFHVFHRHLQRVPVILEMSVFLLHISSNINLIHVWVFVCLCLYVNHFTLRQMPSGDSRLSSHNMSQQYRMHSYYSAASYLSQGLGTAACMPPIFTLEDNVCPEPKTSGQCLVILLSPSPSLSHIHTNAHSTHGPIKFYPEFINSMRKVHLREVHSASQEHHKIHTNE